MATTKRAALYTITLVEVTYEQVARETVASMQPGHMRTMRAATTLTMRIGRHETRTALLVDVPASELADARRMLECGIETVVGERYLITERQRGRIIRETRATRRNRAA